MTILAKIVELYDISIRDMSIDLKVDLEPKHIAKVKGAKDILDQIINRKRAGLGISEIKPINLSLEKAEQLRQAIKSDPEWIDGFQAMIRTLAPELRTSSLDELIAPIQVPWWNAALLSRTGGSYDAVRGILHVDSSLSHSYLPQLMSSEKLVRAKTDSMSVSNVLITSDGLIVLGYRGGHRYSNTIMTVGAGSIELHSGKNPLFETCYTELKEEVKLDKQDLTSVELVGNICDETLQKSTLYVFRSKTSLTFAELLDTWQESIDQNEHKYLLPFPDDPERMLDHIHLNGYDLTRADPQNHAATTIGNAGSILPPCAASLLAHFGQQYGANFIQKARSKLGESYLFESF